MTLKDELNEQKAQLDKKISELEEFENKVMILINSNYQHANPQEKMDQYINFLYFACLQPKAENASLEKIGMNVHPLPACIKSQVFSKTETPIYKETQVSQSDKYKYVFYQPNLEIIADLQKVCVPNVSVNITDEKGRNLLLIALDAHNYHLAGFLLMRGADVSQIDQEGRVAADYINASDSELLIQLMDDSATLDRENQNYLDEALRLVKNYLELQTLQFQSSDGLSESTQFREKVRKVIYNLGLQIIADRKKLLERKEDTFPLHKFAEEFKQYRQELQDACWKNHDESIAELIDRNVYKFINMDNKYADFFKKLSLLSHQFHTQMNFGLHRREIYRSNVMALKHDTLKSTLVEMKNAYLERENRLLKQQLQVKTEQEDLAVQRARLEKQKSQIERKEIACAMHLRLFGRRAGSTHASNSATSNAGTHTDSPQPSTS